MSSCLSVRSIPIIFSACLRSSFLIRDAAGEGVGPGDGVAVGICASAFNGDSDRAKPTAPAAGRSLTKLRRLIEVSFDFFIEASILAVFSYVRNYCCSARGMIVRDSGRRYLIDAALRIRGTILQLHDFGFPGSIDCN